jgi:predicted nucleotidyltransferase component of viral defense system
MRDIALQVAREAGKQRLNVLREYLQNYILGLVQKTGLYLDLYFVGGTALRFLFRIPRFSERMDFSAGPRWRTAGFAAAMTRIRQELNLAGYDVSLHVNDDRTVQKADLRFPGLLYDLKLVPRREQKLTVSLEVDVHPPRGWRGDRTIVNLYSPVLVQHYDLRSMFTAKIATLLTRDYVKGRDYYDLFWYLSKWKGLEPDPALLKNALAQKAHSREKISRTNWKIVIGKIVRASDWRAIEQDIRPFLERVEDILVFTKDNLLLLLSASSGIRSKPREKSSFKGKSASS